MHGGASWHAAAVSPSDPHTDPATRARVVRVERVADTGTEAGIRVVTLDRPERLNALDATLIDDLHDALDTLAADPEVRVVVLTGAGRGFCAGLDLQSSPPTGITSTEGRGRAQRGMDLQQRIATLVPKLRGLRVPVIAAVNGPAAGGGLALALACDIRLAGAAAKFNVAFVRIGLSGCDIGVSWLLPRAIGTTRAYEMMLTGRMVHADEAERIGLVVRTVPDDELIDAAMDTARAICANSPMGIWMTKEVMWSQLEVGSLAAGIDLENRTQILTSFTEDMGEAVAAFLSRRPPEYRNR
jgi:enoyl-CoA hydratase